MPFLTMPEVSGRFAVGQQDCMWADGDKKLVVLCHSKHCFSQCCRRGACRKASPEITNQSVSEELTDLSLELRLGSCFVRGSRWLLPSL